MDLGINYPGDLLVRERQRKVLIKRNTIADFAATRAYQASTTSLISDQGKYPIPALSTVNRQLSALLIQYSLGIRGHAE